jgi:hypothetical protein
MVARAIRPGAGGCAGDEDKVILTGVGDGALGALELVDRTDEDADLLGADALGAHGGDGLDLGLGRWKGTERRRARAGGAEAGGRCWRTPRRSSRHSGWRSRSSGGRGTRSERKARLLEQLELQLEELEAAATEDDLAA